MELKIPTEIQHKFSRNTTERILNGNNASTGQFPFAAYLHISRPTGTVFCTGSLISIWWIITARSCFV